jgi:pyruvate/2-oxoglutarate dehydrogenase complex dihydrolipoamide acyltransferase (E2) component
LQKQKRLNPKNQCSSSSDSVSNSRDEQVQQGDPTIIWKKIDLTKALAWLQENNQRSVKKDCPVVLLIKATARSLADFPDLNAIWENGLQQKKILMLGL